MEETLLQQIKIVNKGQDFVIWISNYSAVTVRIGKEDRVMFKINVCLQLVSLLFHR